MRILFLLCVVVLFSQCGDPKPEAKKKKGLVTTSDYRRFFANVFKDVKRVDPRPLDGDRFSMLKQLSDQSLLAFFTPEDIRFMRRQYLSNRKANLSDYFAGKEFISAQEADSLSALEFGQFEEPEKNGFDAFTLPLFSLDKMTVLIHYRHLGGNYGSYIETVIFHWSGKRWEEKHWLMRTTW